MNSVYDFIMAALPWIAIGLFVAVNAVKMRGDENEFPRWFKCISYGPVVCAGLLAFMEFLDHNSNSATTWMVLAIVMAFTELARMKKNNSQ